MRTSGLLIRRARVRVPPSPHNNSNEIAESVSSDTVSVDTSQSASSGAACPNVSHSPVTVAQDDKWLLLTLTVALSALAGACEDGACRDSLVQMNRGAFWTAHCPPGARMSYETVAVGDMIIRCVCDPADGGAQ